MYIGRGLWYNKVVPLCDMAADSKSGGIVTMILKLRSRQMWAVRLSALATLLLEKTWSWRLSGRWSWSGCSGKQIVILLLPRFVHKYSCVYSYHFT